MKQLIKLSLISQLLCPTSLFAINTINGFYGGLFGGMSHGPSSAHAYFVEDDHIFDGTIGYSAYSGGGGFMLGYRFNQFRGEGEFLINRISTGPVTFGTCTIENKDVLTPTGTCPTAISSNSIGYSGASTAMYGMVNVIWDFFTLDGTTNVAPYLGIGAGMASVQNGNSFTSTTTLSSHGEIQTRNGTAIQGIIGVNYFMDDFTWCSMDFRYVSATLKQESEVVLNRTFTIPSKAYPLSMLNFTINFAFDKGGIYS